jgi:hypothetical protein
MKNIANHPLRFQYFDYIALKSERVDSNESERIWKGSVMT